MAPLKDLSTCSERNKQEACCEGQDRCLRLAGQHRGDFPADWCNKLGSWNDCLRGAVLVGWLELARQCIRFDVLGTWR
ncbi:hypothetical protein AALO_G00084650 [Alosa alosa]|uniref:Uncharacterized protein n=1 Tax=Alosa alosa TaxID=278164 RepID=A0AAV6H3X5_9TELE|nr:hypothetical protein AALO_G00084650 [Alosa alosa]